MYEFLTKNWLDIVIPIATALVGWFLGSFRETAKERNTKLKTHFEELKQEAETSIFPGLSISELHGTIVFANGNNQYTSPLKLPKPSDAFTAHFPQIANDIKSYESGINEHNQRYERFCLKLREVFKSTGLEVMNINQKSLSPHIWDNVFWLFFSWWEAHSQGKTPKFDVTILETDRNFGENQLIAAGCHSQAIVYAETEEGREKCRSAVRDIALNPEYEKEAVQIINSAKLLTGKVATTAHVLKDTLDKIGKFELWHGRHKEFTKQKQCPTCQKYI